MHWYGVAGLHWPDCESHIAHRWMLNRIDSIDKIMAHVEKPRRCCVQAGGYIGMWPLALAKHFEHVHTFEPVPELHAALKRNTQADPSIRTYRQALGEHCGATQLAFRPGGCSTLDLQAERRRRAAHQQQPLGEVLNVQLASIDSFDLADVGLIYLDTERSELDALRGATETVRRCSPVIALEILTGQEQEYGDFMRAYGYEQISYTHRDVVFKKRAHARPLA